jgi:hypothetical protein
MVQALTLCLPLCVAHLFAEAAAPRTSLTGLGGLLGPTATGSMAGLGEEDLVAEPAVNLSNKLNPNNIHYDRELAAR